MKKNSKSQEQDSKHVYPLLPLRDIIVFPSMVTPLFIGRGKSVLALEEAVSTKKLVFLASQVDSKIEDPLSHDIYPVGTLCQVIQMLKLPNGTVKVLVEGKWRGIIESFQSTTDYFSVRVSLHKDSANDPDEAVQARMSALMSAYETYVADAKLPGVTLDSITNLASVTSPDLLVDMIMAQMTVNLQLKQEILSLFDCEERLARLTEIIVAEHEVLHLDRKIKQKVKRQIETNQKEYYLNEQLKVIQKELGKKDEHQEEFNEIEARIQTRRLSVEARKKSLSELKKLKMMSPVSAEAAVTRNYLETILELPWGVVSKTKHDLCFAESVLNRDHYGLNKIKERILEFLAVQTKVKSIKGPILCLVGPPGVGKTSLAKSIAEATARKFVKMSLGGVRDEAEIRGHRRTYVGAMPGKIIAGIKKAGSSNPLFLLDEIDKLSSDFRGDPTSALLEVLDPEQNSKFNDHYLDIEFDLSKVLFIATANSLHGVPRPLIDRLEIIQISGYTDTEKHKIAVQYLIPKQRKYHGLEQDEFRISPAAIDHLINGYTREAGVRGLEKSVAALCRKTAYRIVKGDMRRFTVTSKSLEAFLGPERFKRDKASGAAIPGVVSGLAWTETGGEVLEVEVSVVEGKGNLLVTGKLGEVMNESARAAMTYVRSRTDILGLDKGFYQHVDIHIHVPEGAIPKDGPSAGITMVTALVSALTAKSVCRSIAMTGEISLQGRILAIGGLKEKLMAAVRAGLQSIFVPLDNVKDLKDVDAEILRRLEIVPVGQMDELLARIGLIPPVDSSALVELSSDPLRINMTAH
jgi:ATP-dependent Lon protease